MKYKVHRLEVKWDYVQEKLDHFLNQLEAEVISIVPCVTPVNQVIGATSRANLLLVEEKKEQTGQSIVPRIN